ncbi:MAG: hypothetical protein LBV16_06505 [Elusimicrobiota bacterium]|jgi:hypothetical protein|nr:hypothetical protein [Elusimicrobiota bacterium]
MEIIAKIKGIKYKKEIEKELKTLSLKNFNINSAPSSLIISDEQNTFAISKWVSPKRTRSYPDERIYDTIGISKKITVIPIVKDEGQLGDRDFLQWDTISLMSLLDVFVIFAYYNKAQKSYRKITNQQFDNTYVISKIKEIKQYHSSALHWNLKELQNLHSVIDRIKSNYLAIEKTTKVKLHNFKGLDNFKNRIGKDVDEFMEFSRGKAKKAQNREMLTTQPKENLNSATKAKITITNYLGGQYYFTVDEVEIKSNEVMLIESKHTKNSILPSISDIKDGLLKMILYANLDNVCFNNKNMKSKAVLRLTAKKFIGQIVSNDSLKTINDGFVKNALSQKQIDFVKALFKEAQINQFIVQVQEAK